MTEIEKSIKRIIYQIPSPPPQNLAESFKTEVVGRLKKKKSITIFSHTPYNYHAIEIW